MCIKCLRFYYRAQHFPLSGEVVLLKFNFTLQREQSCNVYKKFKYSRKAKGSVSTSITGKHMNCHHRLHCLMIKVVGKLFKSSGKLLKFTVRLHQTFTHNDEISF